MMMTTRRLGRRCLLALVVVVEVVVMVMVEMRMRTRSAQCCRPDLEEEEEEQAAAAARRCPLRRRVRQALLVDTIQTT